MLPRVFAVVFGAQVLVRLALGFLPPLPAWLAIAVHAAALSLLSAPILCGWAMVPTPWRNAGPALEHADRESEHRRLAQVVEAIADAVVVTDPAGVIRRVNPAFTRITGWHADEAIGRSPRMLRSRHTPPETHADLWRTIRAGRTWSGRLVDVRKDGSEYHAWLAISPVFDERREITGYVGVQRDLSGELDLPLPMAEGREPAAIAEPGGPFAKPLPPVALHRQLERRAA